MFNIKRMATFGLMFLLLSTMLVFTTGVASAHTASPARAALTYDGMNPVSTNCASGAIAEKSNTGAVLTAVYDVTYTIYLYFSPTCNTAWAKLALDEAMPSGYEADAIVTRNNDARQYDCTNGNGVGRSSCYSGMVYDGDGYTAYAAAMFLKIGSTWQQGAHTTSF